MADPLFILAAPRSFTSLACAMLGQHPSMYGLPEVNLFLAHTMEQFWQGSDSDGTRKSPFWPTMRHGLLRAIAQLYAGEQSIESILMAIRWIRRRFSQTTGEVFRELCRRVEPLIPIDKSPAYIGKPLYLERIRATFPNARFIHLVRHPRGQCESMLKARGGKWLLVATGALDRRGPQPILDPQIFWHDANVQIMEFLENLPSRHWIRVRGEDFFLDTEGTLKTICRWLDIPCGRRDISLMRHPEASPYAYVGPVNARLGNDINFLKQPRLRKSKVKRYTVTDPLPWRPDDESFHPYVVALAKSFGYA